MFLFDIIIYTLMVGCFFWSTPQSSEWYPNHNHYKNNFDNVILFDKYILKDVYLPQLMCVDDNNLCHTYLDKINILTCFDLGPEVNQECDNFISCTYLGSISNVNWKCETFPTFPKIENVDILCEGYGTYMLRDTYILYGSCNI